MTNLRIACVAIVKNEQNHVAEWIAYQLAIGFDTVIIFDNQSTDDTAARIRAFAPHHDVRLHEWTMTTPDYQTRCYEHAARSYTDEFDWLAFFDIDEFLVLDPGFDLKSILNLFPATPAIGVPWAMFGSSGHTEKPDGLLIEAFTHRSEPSFGPNRHIKSIIRPKHMLYCHNAHSFAMDGQYRSLTGKPLTFTQGGLLDTDPDYTLGKLHHYFTRSRAHWADKMQRGCHDTSREDSEFEAYDSNEIPDDSARDLAPRVREILANLAHPTPRPQPVSANEARQCSPTTTGERIKRRKRSKPFFLGRKNQRTFVDNRCVRPTLVRRSCGRSWIENFKGLFPRKNESRIAERQGNGLEYACMKFLTRRSLSTHGINALTLTEMSPTTPDAKSSLVRLPELKQLILSDVNSAQTENYANSSVKKSHGFWTEICR